MKIALPRIVKAREDAVIASGIPAEDLMEAAGLGIAQVIYREYGERGYCISYVGKGNNAGDALVVLRHLRDWGWKVGVRTAYSNEEGTELLLKQWSLLPDILVCKEPPRLDESAHPVILLDGLVGLGAEGALREPLLSLAKEMNSLRSEGARVVAVDYPSGVDGETGEIYEGAVVADISAVIAIAKSGLIMDGATSHVGRLCPVPLEKLTLTSAEEAKVSFLGSLIEPDRILNKISPRPYEWFKGSAGRVSIIAGSTGMTGAARLCCEAAMRAGAGMVTLFALPEVYPLLASAVMPEVMVKPVQSYSAVHEVHCDALLIGPGLGMPVTQNERELVDLITQYKGKIILDADALNLIAREGLLPQLNEHHLITPHIGEMDRLLPRLEGETRKEWADRFSQLSSATLLLKGARSFVKARGNDILYNTTGGPGMGTAGQGDVLAGVCSALCAQGLSPFDSAALGMWLCGRSSELALRMQESEQSLIASDTIRYLGQAYKSVQRAEK